MDKATVPNAMISLLLHEQGMQVFVAAGPNDDDRVMEVSFDDPTGPFRYAARVRGSMHGPVIEAVTVSVKPEARQDANAVLNRKVVAAVPLAQLLRGAQEALGWDLQGWGNAIKRSPPPRKGQSYPAEPMRRWPGHIVRRLQRDSRRARSSRRLGGSRERPLAAGSAPLGR